MNMPIGGRALYITLATSGMRIGEASLKDGGIDLNSDPAKIKIPAMMTKTKTARTTFITQEAKCYILEWLKARTDDRRLFSIPKTTAATYWVNACKLCKMDQKDSTTGHMIYHPHVLRKYFRTIGGDINIDATES